MAQPPPFEDTKLGAQALAYVIKLYDELTVENGAPTLGTQNQAVDFIRADPELRLAVADWAKKAGIEEATTAPRQRLPFNRRHRVRWRKPISGAGPLGVDSMTRKTRRKTLAEPGS